MLKMFLKMQGIGYRDNAAIAEVELSALQSSKAAHFAALPKYPFVERDLAILIDKNTEWIRVHDAVVAAGGALLKSVHLFDVFTGGHVPAHQKSLAFRVRLQHAEHTLADAEINGAVEAIKTALKERLNAELR
jgi:phenylalanyl-tRNA synthetase beta chain